MRIIKVLYVTGYKSMELGIFKENDERIPFIKKAIEKKLVALIEEGLEWVIVSGQMGIELWTAEVTMDLKDLYDIQLAIFPPFENQEERWPEDLKMKYQELTLAADFFKPLYNGGYKGAFQFREKNRWFCEKSDGCLILINEEYPGSVKFFHEVAKEKKAYQIYYITPFDLEDIVEEIKMSDPDYWS